MLDQSDTAASAVHRGAVHFKEPETRTLIKNIDCLAKIVCFIWTDIGR